MIYNVAAPESLPAAPTILAPLMLPSAAFRDLLSPVLRQSQLAQPPPTLEESRVSTRQVNSLDASIRRFLNPHVYPVGLEQGLHEFARN